MSLTVSNEHLRKLHRNVIPVQYPVYIDKLGLEPFHILLQPSCFILIIAWISVEHYGSFFETCRRNWWKVLLHINNLSDFFDMVWYCSTKPITELSANFTQYFIISILQSPTLRSLAIFHRRDLKVAPRQSVEKVNISEHETTLLNLYIVTVITFLTMEVVHIIGNNLLRESPSSVPTYSSNKVNGVPSWLAMSALWCLGFSTGLLLIVVAVSPAYLVRGRWLADLHGDLDYPYSDDEETPPGVIHLCSFNCCNVNRCFCTGSHLSLNRSSFFEFPNGSKAFQNVSLRYSNQLAFYELMYLTLIRRPTWTRTSRCLCTRSHRSRKSIVSIKSIIQRFHTL